MFLISHVLFSETEILETRVRSRPKTNITAPEKHQEQAKQTQVQQGSVGVSFVLIITLLVIPVVVLVAIALFIRWRKNRVYGGIFSEMSIHNFYMVDVYWSHVYFHLVEDHSEIK